MFFLYENLCLIFPDALFTFNLENINKTTKEKNKEPDESQATQSIKTLGFVCNLKDYTFGL
jgi:hypothetical protein